MNKTILKIALIIMPIVCYAITGWIVSGTMSYLMNNGLFPPDPVAFAMSLLSFGVLGYTIYYSIKLWIKHILPLEKK
jgi:hypothetical protein